MLDEDNELTIARFMKGLSPSIANKMKLRPCLSLDDVCNLTIKIERQLKGRKLFQSRSSNWPQGTPKSFSFLNKVDTIPTPIKTLDKDKGIASEPSKRLEGKKFFKFHDYGYF